jgi:hypothetical protein
MFEFMASGIVGRLAQNKCKVYVTPGMDCIWLIVAAVSEAVLAEPVPIVMLHPSSNALPGMAHNQADAACV